MSLQQYDAVVFGAGIFGLYAARFWGRQGRSVAVIDCDPQPYSRASFANQARIHRGYHYPRSVYTAAKTAGYYERFVQDFGFAVNRSFRQIYAISRANSFTNAAQFKRFCEHVGIRCDEAELTQFFRPDMVEAAFETDEVAVDPGLMKEWLLQECTALGQVKLLLGWNLERVERSSDEFLLTFGDGAIRTPAVLNATYAGTNQVSALFGHQPFAIKYELCEVALIQAGPALSGVGITLMDGPFFSLMPFGASSAHSLTAVPYTPHFTSEAALPTFACQQGHESCSPARLSNCNTCSHRPGSSWRFMAQMARNYLNPGLEFRYTESLYAMKVVLRSTEADDARPTLIRRFSDRPWFAAVLSGKLNTIYDLEACLA